MLFCASFKIPIFARSLSMYRWKLDSLKGLHISVLRHLWIEPGPRPFIVATVSMISGWCVVRWSVANVGHHLKPIVWDKPWKNCLQAKDLRNQKGLICSHSHMSSHVVHKAHLMCLPWMAKQRNTITGLFTWFDVPVNRHPVFWQFVYLHWENSM